jgi:hypothetical protein
VQYFYSTVIPDDAKAAIRNPEIPGLVLAHHPGMTPPIINIAGLF